MARITHSRHDAFVRRGRSRTTTARTEAATCPDRIWMIMRTLKATDPSAEFLTKFRALIEARAKDGDISDDDVKAIFRAARGYAGGKGKAKKAVPMTATESDESFEEQIREICLALNTKYPGTNGYSGQYWIQATYPSYLIVSDPQNGEYYKIPYMENGDDIVFGDLVEV